MKLSKVAILALKGSGVDFKERLAKSIGVSLQTLYRYIVENDDAMTKAAAMELIREMTGLDDDEILEREATENLSVNP